MTRDLFTNSWRLLHQWNDDSSTGDWDADLKRFVYDGNALAQEHQFSASGNGMWIYNYVRYDRDYLHKPDGVRQRSYVGPTSYTDEFLFRDMADIASKVPRGSSATVTRAPRMASGERTPENDLAPSTSSFTDISHLGAHGAFTECYGGGTSNPRTQGFDALIQSSSVHQLPALGGMLLNSPTGRPRSYDRSHSQGLRGAQGQAPVSTMPLDLALAKAIDPGDITSLDDAVDTGHQLTEDSELDCECEEAIERITAHCHDQDRYYCWQRMCYTTIKVEQPIGDPWSHSVFLQCGWPPCDNAHQEDFPFDPFRSTDRIFSGDHFTLWGAEIHCCPCNVCPGLGTEPEAGHLVVQTNICPYRVMFTEVGLSNNVWWTLTSGADVDLPTDIWDALRELFEALLNYSGVRPCPTIVANQIEGSMDFAGEHGNVFLYQGCLPCRCASARTGFYRS